MLLAAARVPSAVPSPALLLVLAGLAQLGLAAGSLAVPRILGWRAETAKLRPLTRQVFWTYAGYILTSHFAFGTLSVLAPGALLAGDTLARAVCAYIALHWGVRLVLQFAVFDRADAPDTWWARAGEAGLVAVWVFCTVLYGALAAGVRWGA